MRAASVIWKAAIVASASITGGLGGCTTGASGPVPSVSEPCKGPRTDNGDGTSTVVCLDGTKELQCTAPTCDGFTCIRIEEGADVASVNMPTLSGPLDCISAMWNPVLKRLVLPNLGAVGWVVLHRNPSLANVDLQSLTTTVWGLHVSANESLVDLGLRSLTEVQHPMVCALDMGCQGGAEVRGNRALTRLDFPALSRAGSLVVTDNSALSHIDLRELQVVSGGRTCGKSEATCSGGLVVARNAALSVLSAPLLSEAGSVEVSSNAEMKRLELPALTSIPAQPDYANVMLVQGNSALPHCQAEAILAQLINFTGTATISGNDTAGTCPP